VATTDLATGKGKILNRCSALSISYTDLPWKKIDYALKDRLRMDKQKTKKSLLNE